MNAPHSILVVDDDPESLALAVGILAKEGYLVLPADSGELALESLDAREPELILLDVRLPGIDGFEVCRRLRSRPGTQDTPVILISAFLERREWTLGLEAGATDFLAKPYTEAEFLARIQTHLRLVHTLAALREKEFQYRNLADSGLALIWRSGTDKKCSYFNKPWLTFTGRPLEDELGDGWARGVHPEDLARCIAIYEGAFDRRQAFEMRYRLRHHTGDYRWILDLGTPNFDTKGVFLGYIGHCIDITDQVSQQENLQRNDRLDALGILAGGIAHDFNNLLAGLFANVSMARNEVSGHPGAARHLDKALGAYERAKDLTRQLLTFSKGGEPIRKTGDLGALVRESVGFGLSGSMAACEFHLDADLRPCDFDANQIGQVMGNLIINAEQAMPQGGAIKVSARNITLRSGEKSGLIGGDYVEVSVTDTGTGITAANLPRIFDPFFTTKPKGNGLGLPTCYSILQKHHGGIEVESFVDQGTTFRIFLPATDHPKEAEAPARPTEHHGSGIFLVLDDEELLRELGSEWLTEFGYTPVTVRDGDEALALVDLWTRTAVAPVGALLDLTVPGGRGGRETVGALLRAFPRLQVIATSGYSEDPVLARPEDYGFCGSLSKPFLKDELGRLLNRCFGRCS